MRVALVVPHIFMHAPIMQDAIFSPGELALELAMGLDKLGVDVTLFSPGPVKVSGGVKNVTANRSGFEEELRLRGDSYMDLLKKHPLTFITLSRQLQAKLIANAYERANGGEFDVVHVYTNEEELGMIFARFCKVPVVFTHHDPFNFQVKYRALMPEFKHLNWISISLSQRKNMPPRH